MKRVMALAAAMIFMATALTAVADSSPTYRSEVQNALNAAQTLSLATLAAINKEIDDRKKRGGRGKGGSDTNCPNKNNYNSCSNDRLNQLRVAELARLTQIQGYLANLQGTSDAELWNWVVALGLQQQVSTNS